MEYTQIVASATRALERLAIVSAGVLCVWFGYQLFATVPLSDSTLNVSLGSYVINVTKVGPGIVFAGFGIFLLWHCLKAVVRIDGPITRAGSATDNAAEKPDVKVLTGSLIYGLPAAKHSTDLVRLKNDIAVLNTLAVLGPRGIDHVDVERAAHQARIALLAQNWDMAWGDMSAFASLREGDVPTSGPVSELYNAQLNPEFGARDKEAS